MSMCCIGGVCVPYSAVLPLLALCLKWIVTKLAAAGLLPQIVADKLGVGNNTNCCNSNDDENKGSDPSCCNKSSSTTGTGSTSDDDDDRRDGMVHVTSMEEWEAMITKHGNKNNNHGTKLIVAKMTAAWCQPCHKIQPFFERLAKQYHSTNGDISNTVTTTAPTPGTVLFCTVDVDGCDSVAAQYRVSMMPTFLILMMQSPSEWKLIDRYSGSDTTQLKQFLIKHELLSSTS